MKPYESFEDFQYDNWLFEASGLPGCMSAYNGCRSPKMILKKASTITEECWDTCGRCKPKQTKQRGTP